MKCTECGRIVRKVNGALVSHPCAKPEPKPQRQRRNPRIADRETQHCRYLDSGPLNWDDSGYYEDGG